MADGRRWPVVLVLLGVVNVWGVAFSGIKLLLRDLSPGALTAGRLLVAALTYSVLIAVMRPAPVARRSGDLWRLVVAGLLSSVAYHLALNWGEQYIDAGVASLIVAAMPVMVAVLSVPLLGERLGPRRAAGVLVAFGGVVVLVVSSGQGLEVRSTAGAIVTLISPVSWAFYTIVAKPLAARYDGVRLNVIGGWVGALVVLPLGLREAGNFVRLGVEGWLWLVFLGAVSTAFAYAAFVWTLRRWTASASASFIYLVPASALLWAWGLLGEVPSVWALAGGALIVGGVVIVQRTR